MHSSPPSLFLMMTSQITQKEKAGLDAAVAFPRRSWFTASCQKDQSSISAQTLSLSRKLLKICQKRHITSCSDKLQEANSSAKKPKDLRLKLNNNYHGGRNCPVQLKGSVGCRMIDSLTVRVMDKTIIQSIKSGKPRPMCRNSHSFRLFTADGEIWARTSTSAGHLQKARTHTPLKPSNSEFTRKLPILHIHMQISVSSDWIIQDFTSHDIKP